MPTCAVACCGNSSKKTKGGIIKYYSFPKNADLRRKWIIACRRGDKMNTKNACVCSIHFDVNSYYTPLKQRLLNYCPKNARNLKDEAVPTLNVPRVSRATHSQNNEERALRWAKRNRKKEIEELLKAYDKNTHEEPVMHVDNNTDVDSEQQTPASVSQASQIEVDELSERIKLLEHQNTELQKRIDENTALNEQYEGMFNRVFTQGQIKKLKNWERAVHWSFEDIANAIALHSVSPKAYRYLKLNNYPLPALSTLYKWVLNFDLNQGILTNIITLMKKKASDFTQMERLCVITFDKMYASNRNDIDKKQDDTGGLHKSCQTVMVHGLLSNWSQPVYYQFDQPMTKEIIEEIILKLFHAKFIVVALCTNMKIENIDLWSKLNVGYNKSCFFSHPCDGSLKIFVYADVPCLIRLARDNLIDNGFIIDDCILNIGFLQPLVDISTPELTLTHKLTPNHLYVKGTEPRERVRLAIQIFSNSVARAIEYCGENGLMPKNSNFKKAAATIQLFNDWFNLLQSKCKLDENSPGRNAFGTDLDNQRNLLNQMSELIEKMRIGKHVELVQFQKGILLTNTSLTQMYDYLKSKYEVRYILTSRLSQDVLDNCFAYIQGRGGANDSSSPSNFKCLLKRYILGQKAAVFTENEKTAENKESILNETKFAASNVTITEDNCLTQNMLLNLVTKPCKMRKKN